MKIEKYQTHRWFVKIDGQLVAGFHQEKHADLFIKALEDEER